MSCDRNLTVEEWLEIVHGFWQVGRDRGFGPSGWISRLNVTITNVSKVLVFSMDSVPCFISMCWQDRHWISGAVVLEGLVDSILFEASVLQCDDQASVGISSNGPWRIGFDHCRFCPLVSGCWQDIDGGPPRIGEFGPKAVSMYFFLWGSTVYLVFGIVHSLWIWSKAPRLDLCLNVLTGYRPGGRRV